MYTRDDAVHQELTISGSAVRVYLKELCRQFDDSILRARLQRVEVASAVPVSMLVAGWACEDFGAPEVPMYAAVFNDGIDNDDDGRTDCDDPDCAGLDLCG